MSEHEAPFGADQESILAGHQPDKVNMATILIFGVVLVIVCILTFLILGFMMGLFSQADIRRNQLVSPLFESNDGLYPAPRLQARPPADMERYNRDMSALVDGYGWVDKKADSARIPISRAIDLSLQNPSLFPHRQNPVIQKISPGGDLPPTPAEPAPAPTDAKPEPAPVPAPAAAATPGEAVQ